MPGRNGGWKFHGERRSNDTNASVTDPEAEFSFMGQVLMENRNDLMVGATLIQDRSGVERSATLC